MKTTYRLIFTLAIIAIILLILNITRSKEISDFSPNPQPPVGIANPASQNCVTSGGKLAITATEDGGQVGICTLPNGKSCEEWALYRGECN